MAKKPVRVILDTNIFISYLLGNSFSRLDNFFRQEEVKLIFSEELLNEFLEVIARPKLRKYFSQEDIILLLDQIQTKAEFIEVSSTINICRDIKDNFLLALCVDGRADFLITGDEDLLVLKKFRRTSIVRYREFVKG